MKVLRGTVFMIHSNRIIIVDEFKALQDFKENQKCVLWGHNQFGEEH